MVMIKLVLKGDVKNVRNYFMFLKLANIVLNVLESYGSSYILTIKGTKTNPKKGADLIDPDAFFRSLVGEHVAHNLQDP